MIALPQQVNESSCKPPHVTHPCLPERGQSLSSPPCLPDQPRLACCGYHACTSASCHLWHRCMRTGSRQQAAGTGSRQNSGYSRGWRIRRDVCWVTGEVAPALASGPLRCSQHSTHVARALPAHRPRPCLRQHTHRFCPLCWLRPRPASHDERTQKILLNMCVAPTCSTPLDGGHAPMALAEQHGCAARPCMHATRRWNARGGACAAFCRMCGDVRTPFAD